MKHLVILLALVCGTLGEPRSGVRVRFDVGFGIGTDFFIPIARTIADAVSKGWTQTARPASRLPSLVMYCSPDRMVCALYDLEGIIAGLQIAIAQDDIVGSTLDWKTQGFVEWTATTDDGETLKFWAIHQYFISQETLDLPKEERIKSTKSNQILREDAVWVTGFDNQLMQIPTNSANLERIGFTRQACIPWMGLHYYYNMTETASCASGQLYPWFPICHSGKTVATGLIMTGKLAFTKRTKKNWFENPGKAAVMAIVPRGPPCLYGLAETPGIVTMHIYYIDEPWVISCLGYN